MFEASGQIGPACILAPKETLEDKHNIAYLELMFINNYYKFHI